MTRRKLLIWASALNLSFLPFRLFAATTLDSNFIGVWSGKLAIGSISLRLRLEIINNIDAKLFSIDQGDAPISGRILSLGNGKIEIEFPAIRAKFSGAGNDEEIVGKFKQGPNDTPLRLLKGPEAGFTISDEATPLTQEILDQIRSEAQSPAIIAAAQIRGKNAVKIVSGTRIFNGESPATAQDKWHLGSITKSMTAVLTARLIERGLLNWDTKISDILGQKIPQMLEEYKEATVLHLLSHQSGLAPNIPVLKTLAFINSKKSLVEDRVDYASAALIQTPSGLKGQHFEYSNNGYIVLGTMLEQLSNKSWEELITEEVFAPLDMKNVGFGAPLGDQPQGHSKAPFRDTRKPAKTIGKGFTDNPRALGPAGTVHASADDVLKYIAAHRDYNPILKPESWAMLHKVHFGGQYACGLIRNSDGSLWHNGSNTLWYAEISFDPEAGTCGFACANDGYLQKSAPAVGKALKGIISAAKA